MDKEFLQFLGKGIHEIEEANKRKIEELLKQIEELSTQNYYLGYAYLFVTTYPVEEEKDDGRSDHNT